MASGFWLGATLTPLLFSDIALAELIVPDDTLGREPSAVSTGATANDFVIDGGVQRNTALFHSFERFGINSNQTVFFENPASVENIITRVTGGLPSNIDGLLGVDGPANLFLANPSGIIFGPNAQLDVAGAFVATTADQFLFANGTSFNAVNPNAPPLLTVSVPLGVQFGANPQPITVNGATLEAGVGKPFVLLGGDVTLNDANILAPGGRVGLAGRSQSGTILLNLEAPTPQNFLTVPPLGRANLSLNNSNINTVSEGNGDIVVQAQNISFIETTLIAGLNEDVDSLDTHGGSIIVKGTGDLQLTDSIIQTSVKENGQGGDIHINATNHLFLNGESEISILAEGFESDAGDIFINAPDIRLNSSSSIASVTQASGGDINLTTHSLWVRQNSDIATSKFGPNTSDGNIRIRAHHILIDNRGGDHSRPPIGITTDVSFIPQDLGLPPETIGGTGGKIEIDTQNLTLIGGLIGSTAFGNAQGGDLTIRARDTVRLVGEPAAARDNFAGIAELSTAIRDATLEGVSGDLRIDARHLILANGSTINAGAFGLGNSGDILINTTESVTLQGTLNGQPSQIIAQLQNTGPFEGGNIDLVTGRLTLRDGGQISASTIAESEGNGRNVSIIANQGVFITGSSPRIELPPGNADFPFVLDPTGTRFPSGIFASSLGEGNAGNVDIFSPNITVNNGAQISVSSTNAGAAGSLFIRGNNVVLDNAALLAEAVEGDLANIELSIRDSLQLLNGSRISTVAREDADGSNIIIRGTDTQLLRFLIFEGGSTISTENSGRFGTGGNIDIAAQFILAFPGELNQIIANAFEGDGGDINIFTNAIFGPQFLNISASSQLGVNGEINIETIATDPANALTQLPENVLDNSTQIADACAVPRSGQSQFVVTGRGGLPLMPSSRPVGSYLLSDLRTQAPPVAQPVLQEAKRLVVTARGDYYLQGESSRSLPQLLEAARQAYQQVNYSEAITYWTQAVNQLSKSKHPGAYASVQSHLALAYHHLGDWDKAREAMAASQAVLTPELIAQQPALHAQVLNTRASLFLTRGNMRSALEDWQQAAAVYHRAGDDLGNLKARLNQIQALQDLGYLRQAQQRLVQLMQPLEQQPASPIKAIGQLNLGKVLRAEGSWLRSQRQLEAALTTAQSLNQPALTSTILLNLGHTFRGQGNPQKALDYYQQAREIAPTPLIQFQVQVSRYDLLVV
uniref:two-partner secretion domain-containing protein n=1 Tax=Acaryochloris sp. IP29b_bin.148 TaxID=2969218 RepID=UPI00263A01E1